METLKDNDNVIEDLLKKSVYSVSVIDGRTIRSPYQWAQSEDGRLGIRTIPVTGNQRQRHPRLQFNVAGAEGWKVVTKKVFLETAAAHIPA